MQIKNNYDVPWFKAGEKRHGSIQRRYRHLINIDKANDILNVKFDDREAMYSSLSMQSSLSLLMQ